MNVYYLGPQSSYSYLIGRKAFGESVYSLVPLGSFGDIFRKIAAEDGSLGIIPVENSITSNVHENIDWLFSGQFSIVGEAYLLIRLHLLSLPGVQADEIDIIYSHPKALLQCSSFLKDRPEVRTMGTPSTAEAAANVATNRERRAAVIGSEALAEEYGLSVLSRDLGNDGRNFTRFLFVAQSPIHLFDSGSKLTLTFQVRHEPGALVKVLSALGEQGANLTKIESRPIAGREWEYNFWIDVEIDPQRKAAILDAVRKTTLEYQLLGFYPKGVLYES